MSSGYARHQYLKQLLKGANCLFGCSVTISDLDRQAAIVDDDASSGCQFTSTHRQALKY